MPEYPMEISEGLKQCFIEMSRARAKALTLCNKQSGIWCYGKIKDCPFRAINRDDNPFCRLVE